MNELSERLRRAAKMFDVARRGGVCADEVDPVKSANMYEGRIKPSDGDWLPSVFTGDSQHIIFDDAVLDVLKTHDVSLDTIHEKLESENVKRVIVAAVEEIFWGASAAKVNRFAAVVANVIEVDKSDQELEDVMHSSGRSTSLQKTWDDGR